MSEYFSYTENEDDGLLYFNGSTRKAAMNGLRDELGIDLGEITAKDIKGADSPKMFRGAISLEKYRELKAGTME